MSVIWYKVWYDLWRNKLRTLLVVVSIAVGVFAVGTTFGLVEQLLPNMDASHRSTRPAHATLYTSRSLDRDTILALRRVPGVASVEPLNEMEVRYKLTPDGEWKKGDMVARDDYDHQTYDVVQLRQGEWPKGRNIGIERMHSPWYKIFIGSQVIFEIDGQPHTFPVTGIIRHPFVPPPSMYDLAFFFGDAEMMELYGIPLGRFSVIKLCVAPYTPDYARLVTSAVKERLAQQGIGVDAVMYQDPNKHWGRVFMDGMSLVLQVLAVLSMLLSVVLVLNTLTAIITQQTNQIGILKAIGGSGLTITRVYLAGVLVYGLLALAIALPLGALVSFQSTRSFLAMFNIDYDQFTISSRTLIVQAISALVAPLAAGLIPILGGATISVRQAIASYGLGGNFGSSWIDRLVERIGRHFLASYNAMALANTFRRKARLILTELTLVTAGVMFLMVMSLSSSITATLDKEFSLRNYDVLFNFNNLQRVDRMVALVQTIPGVQKADMWLVFPVSILHQGQKALDAGLGSQIQGVPVDDPMATPYMVAGRWLLPGDRFAVVMNRDTAEDENIRVGEMIQLDMGPFGSRDWQVVGLYQSFLMSGGGYGVDAIYAPRPAVFEASKKVNKAATLLVRTYRHGLEDVNQIAASLEDTFDARHIEVDTSETLPQTRITGEGSFSIMVSMMLSLAIIVAVVGGIGLMGSLWIGVIERTKEIGILRAIGASSLNITGMFMLESLIQGLMSWLIAVPLAYALGPAMASALGQVMFNFALIYAFNGQAVLVWLAVIVVISLLASAIPAHNAAQINIRQSLNYE